MRLLFYGLQNSGATLLTLLAGQRPQSIVIPDLWTMHGAPQIRDDVDVCIKATITTSFPLNSHRAAYQPHHTFLIVRRPQDNYVSLRGKHYARHNGSVEQKFQLADAHFGDSSRFSGVFFFEDVVADPTAFIDSLSNVGWRLPSDATEFPRTSLDMERFTWTHASWLYERVQWGSGEARIDPWRSIKLSAVQDTEADAFARQFAPRLHAEYAKRPLPRSVRCITRTAQDEADLQARQQFLNGQLRQAEGLLQAGAPQEAIDLCEELTGLAADVPALWDCMARAHEALGAVDTAARIWVNAEPATPADTSELKTLQAQQALRLGDEDRCRTLAESALALDSRSVLAPLLLADLALRNSQWREASALAESVLTIQPGSGRAALLLARAQEGQGDNGAAIETLRRALAVSPSLIPARRMLDELVSGQ